MGKPQSTLVKPLQKYFHCGEMNFTVGDAAAVMDRVRKLPGAAITELDGVTARYKDWWCNVRASNTEPVVRLNLEADSKALMEAKVAELKKLIVG
ncbi:MAG: hypothetical protein QM796_07830 [Chthoniobacteraceae bacterium]